MRLGERPEDKLRGRQMHAGHRFRSLRSIPGVLGQGGVHTHSNQLDRTHRVLEHIRLGWNNRAAHCSQDLLRGLWTSSTAHVRPQFKCYT